MYDLIPATVMLIGMFFLNIYGVKKKRELFKKYLEFTNPQELPALYQKKYKKADIPESEWLVSLKKEIEKEAQGFAMKNTVVYSLLIAFMCTFAYLFVMSFAH